MRYDQTMTYKNGRALPVFPFTDGKSADYDPAASAIVRYCVYIETDYDMDGDGRRDLVKTFVQVPRSAAEGNYKAATLYEPRPYCCGVNADGYDHMKQVEALDPPPFDRSLLDGTAPARIPTEYADTMTAAFKAEQSDWYYPYAGEGNAFCYNNIDTYDYYLVRGFAVVLCAGFGTYGSDGFEYAGSHYERDAFKAVVEWLHGDRIAYTDRTGTTAIRADWSNGNVAMTGRSYAGTMPFAVATTGVAGLKTIIPVAGIADWYSQQNMQGAQRYWPQEVLNSFLCYFCASQYHEPGRDAEYRDRLHQFFHWMSMEQLKTGCDYSDFWKDGNYTLQADQIRCSALIVHGLHDENVSTKQFEMMLHAFEQSGTTAKLLLHQGPHITPSMPDKGYAIEVDGQFYEDIVNEWLCHYLYDLENDAPNRPAVLVQSNIDPNRWFTSDSWETGHRLTLLCEEQTTAVIDTDWDAAGITPENYDAKMSTASSGMNCRFLTEELHEEVTIQGTVQVNFRAALAGGDAEADFHPANPNDADRLTMQIATAAGKQDDIKLCLLLCDIAEDAFPNIASSDPQRNLVPMSTVAAGTIPLGGDLPKLDIRRFDPVNTNFSIISRAYIDLCNPESGYDPTTAEASITLRENEYHDYHVYLNATRYTTAPGHRLALVFTTEDPINCLIHKDYKAAIDGASVEMILPVTEEIIADPLHLTIDKA